MNVATTNKSISNEKYLSNQIKRTSGFFVGNMSIRIQDSQLDTGARIYLWHVKNVNKNALCTKILVWAKGVAMQAEG